MIGGLGAPAIAVAGITNILIYNVWALFAGINESINYLVSQNFGENTMANGNQRMQIALLLALGLDVLWLLSSIALPYHILTWLGANPTIVQDGTQYLRIRMISFAFTLFTNIFYAYMRAVGDTRTPMTISLVTNVLLIPLTYLMTYGAFHFHGFGLNGSAWSMVITEALGMALGTACLLRSVRRQILQRELA